MESQRTVRTDQGPQARVLTGPSALFLGSTGHLLPGNRLRSNSRLFC